MGDIKLDLKDKKILFELDFHARESNSAIAKKVRLSKQGVDYKIRNLVKKGVIKSFSPVINGNQLGYFYCRIFIKFQNLTKDKEQEIIAYFMKNAQCKWMLKAEGTYDLMFATWTKSLREFKDISEGFVEKYGMYIKQKDESLGVKLTHFQARYLLGKQDSEEYYFQEAEKATEIDQTDKQILRLVSEDARMPLVEIAKRTGVSAKVVSYRLKRLQDEKVILGYRPNIDNDLIGFSYYKILFYLTNITQEKLAALKNFLKIQAEVMYIVEEVGISDIDIEIMLPKGRSVYEFVDRIRFEFPTLIRDYEAFSIKMLKVNLLPF
jgi:DNA-binding Lrp family transcriptional regulator